MNIDRPSLIRARLLEALAPCEVEVQDDSHLHAGHVGARDGGGHYSVRIVAEQFDGLAPLARHRKVYAALDELMNGSIHALAITALTPDEAA
ncbi:MAG: BolA family transcriptional regulator [Gammaproteobacteria bacterium]|nr:BolA family transcriptional regulator [Gammaproteobacteria bacterium]